MIKDLSNRGWVIAASGLCLFILACTSCAGGFEPSEASLLESQRLGVDEFIPVEVGGSEVLPPSIAAPGQTLLGQRHVLRTITSAGTMDLFIAQISSGGSSQAQSCEAANLSEWGLGVVECSSETEHGDELTVRRLFTNDGQLGLLLKGPLETTHVIFALADQRVAVQLVDGYSLLSIEGTQCPGETAQLEAWNESELLVALEDVTLCQ